MSSERWNQINELFLEALNHKTETREAFLQKACASDVSLIPEVQSLLTAYLRAGDFIQQPVAENITDLLVKDAVQLRPADRIAAYSIVREVGRGGFGAVYLGARADERFHKKVAIKLIKRGMDTDDVLKHFHNEQQILGNLDHPNIARLIDAGSTDSGLPYFIMEYVEGHPIDLYCDQQSLSITNRLQLFLQVCAAVSYAHRNLVVHRDLKPTNILVNGDGVPKLLDFGIAKILQPEGGRSTVTAIRPMTPEYASPEQVLGLPVTTLSDVYSLGVVLYELLTGHAPYLLKNRTALEIARTITETQPQLPSDVIHTAEQNGNGESPSLSPEFVSKTREGTPDKLRRRLRGDLDNIVLMAMRKESHRRYQSVDRLAEDIRRHLEGLPITARKDSFIYRTARFIDRNKITAAITLLSLLIILFSAGLIRWRANKQAKLFQEFGQEVSRIEATMHEAYLLPLHDIREDKKHVVQRLEYIKKQMQEIGSGGYGFGFYSLGRGYLSLHRYQDAYDNLILAWQKH
ncbi:MAG TPA: serine/threonine-protein kinase, partial [Acidobacteriota bacterium]